MLTVAQPEDGCGQVNEGQKMGIQLLIARGHAAKLLEAAEEPLNGVPLGVTGHVVGPRAAALGRGGITAQVPRAARALPSGSES